MIISTDSKKNIICQNKKARYEYSIEEVFEAGLVLQGTEVKALRSNKASIQEGYISQTDSGLEIVNVTISTYKYTAITKSHNERRSRKLLLHKKEINKITGLISKKGYTAIPLSLYFNSKGMVKLEFALAKGKKLYDKRATLKEKSVLLEQKKDLKYRIKI
jgi:SsrA-binding protein